MGGQRLDKAINYNQINKESMGKIKKAWEWLSGKKTTIGAVLYIISNIAEQFPVAKPYAAVTKTVLEFWFPLAVAHTGLKTQKGQALLSTIKSALAKNK